MEPEVLEPNLDDLLEDIHRIIDEDDALPLETTYEEQPPKPASHPAHWTQTQKLPKHVAKLQKNPEQAYAEWLYAQEHQSEPADHGEEETCEPEPVKKKHGFRNAFFCLLTLAVLLFAAVVFLLPRQPAAKDGLGARKAGISTILLAGTDQSGQRTDTLILLTADRAERRLSLVSIPRDTLVEGPYSVPKINAVYGVNNGGAEGMDMLLTRVSQCIGFRPDGYILIEMDAFQKLIDTMGGVTFDVPVDMYYNDPAQDLFINLTAGRQTLTGKEAMGVVRFRTGYADADLGRIQVQRSLLTALIDQMVSVEGIARSPQILQVLLEHTASDLTTANYLWLAETALLADLGSIQTVTLPGAARNFSGGSYYVLDPVLAAETVNTYCNPYETEITTEHLTIRQG